MALQAKGYQNGEANTKRTVLDSGMDEGRKSVIIIAASILVARKLAQNRSRPSPARKAAIAEAIQNAEWIMQRIDAKWPNGTTR
jgi:hypothetical protein